VIAWRISDEDRTYLTELRNGVLNHRAVEAVPAGATTFTLARLDLIGMVTGALDPAAALSDGTVVVDGDVGVLARLVGVLAEPDPDFDIVVP
jgi:alkyl sulfatase BDS1-like metallo-beta-lactamase superfamily hydrolase